MIKEIVEFFFIGAVFSSILIVVSKIILTKIIVKDFDYYGEGDVFCEDNHSFGEGKNSCKKGEDRS